MQEIVRQYKNNIGIVVLLLLYIAINMYFTFQGAYYMNVIPVALLLLYLAFTRLDVVYFIVIACTPLSIPLIEFFRSSPVDFYIPTEPILFGVMTLLLFKMAKENFIDRRVINHPVSLAILFNLFWILITSITSTLPLVSFKFLLARLWFLSTFYLLAIHLFKDPRNIPRFIWAYTLPLLIVILYAINRHLDWGLYDKQAAHIVANPFYRDHTSYGAILAMILFAFVGVNLRPKQSFLRKMVLWAVFALLLLALILSYTRAAWISVICGTFIIIFTILHIKFKYIALAVILVLAFAYSNRISIVQKLEKNKQDSSANITEHIQSVTNIATDASNLERLNRWAAAYRMFKEKPIFGFGPGTYMFKYAPYQHSSQKTVISTNFGDLGNAHSEYIGPLAESGIFGALSFILIGIIAIYRGYQVYNRIAEIHLKIVVLTSMMALITYFIHGFLNNFLDTDKASALFWGFIAMIVSLDIYYKEGGKRNYIIKSDLPEEKRKSWNHPN